MMGEHQQAAVISPRFCSPLPTNLVISKKNSIMSDEKYVVRDVNGNVGFKVRGYPFSLHSRRVILDAADTPIVTLRNTIFTWHDRWEVFLGESSDPKDLIFSTKVSSLFQLNTKLHVFLANNISENVCDYALKAEGWSEKSCVIYAGDSSTIIGQMKKERSSQSIFIGKHKLMVSIKPNVDYAFIVALIIIFQEIKSQRRQNSTSNNMHSHSHTPT